MMGTPHGIDDDVEDEGPDGEVRAALCWFGDAALVEVEQLNLPAPGLEAIYQDLLTFRDEDLRWWRPVVGGGWTVLAGEDWVERSRPHRLEGLYPCLLPVLPIRAPEEGDELQGGAVEAGRVGPVEAVLRSAVWCRRFYLDGRLPMWDAEAALVRSYLITTDGNVWAPGVQSEQWYVYGQGGWEVSSPPTDDMVVRQAEDVLSSSPSAARVMSVGPLFPETITPDWDPPR